jgi:hypothetical protein
LWQVGRTRNILAMDFNVIMLDRGEHRGMVLRHVLLVSPKTGRAGMFVWLLDRQEADTYVLADAQMQFLAAGWTLGPSEK